MRTRAPTALDENLGRMIRVRRLQLGDAMLDVAKRIGVKVATVHHWETARSRISAADLYRLARGLRTPIGWFFGRGGDYGDAEALDDYAAAAEAMLLCPELEAIPRLTPAQLQAVRSMLSAMAPPLAATSNQGHK